MRLLCTLTGGLLIGLDREEHGRTAGLRTTLLVGLAASLSMIQVNVLMDMARKASNSFVVMDLMRLPLGILSGIGFIGASAILRRGNAVVGVTTAATLWFVTVMSLCFGGGQIVLGTVALLLGLVSLTGLKWFERRWKEDRRATLLLVAGRNASGEDEIVHLFEAAGYKIRFMSIGLGENATLRRLECEVSWRGRREDTKPPACLGQLASRFGLERADWRNQDTH